MARRKSEEDGKCATCHHYRYEPETKTWICKNQESDNFALEVSYDDSCIDHEERW